MSSTSDDHPLLIAVYGLFRDHRPQTLRDVVETLNVSESAAMTALERLEQMDVLVRSRAGTDTPVWKRHPEANEGHVGLGDAATPS